MIIKISPKIIHKVSIFLKKGGLVICPTDTVYGFLADASNKKAVDKIFKIKKRPKSNPLSLFVKNFKMANRIAFINEKQANILNKFWPGKYTFRIKRKPKKDLYGVDKNTIAIRIPKYKFLNDLLNKINKPLVQTSVNISGKNPLNKINDIINTFEGLDILIINGGNIKKGKPSKILDLTQNTIKTLRK
ncbi:MAG: hypothetical protein UR46_C0003G0005 [Parcubacteria group bacterium GW2011_GWA1_33_6]|nr:MAG: hypothetical protein UR46_C0003G0005 [Parcubacteria group bacterium GW2011_GWA1_33_6]